MHLNSRPCCAGRAMRRVHQGQKNLSMFDVAQRPRNSFIWKHSSSLRVFHSKTFRDFSVKGFDIAPSWMAACQVPLKHRTTQLNGWKRILISNPPLTFSKQRIPWFLISCRAFLVFLLPKKSSKFSNEPAKGPSLSRLICFTFLWMIISGCATIQPHLSSRLLRASKENFLAAALVNTDKVCKWMRLKSRRRREKRKRNETGRKV